MAQIKPAEVSAILRQQLAGFKDEKALEEISQKKGTLYSTEVSDICIKLFTEKGFKLEIK